MFPLPILTYVKIAVVAVLVLGAGYTGYSLEAARFDRYKAEQISLVQKLQEQHQEATDQIRKDKDVKISSINRQLDSAIDKLRSRPSRTQAASNGQVNSGCTGAQLYGEDATVLEREAARADTIKVALQACYAQYDTLSK